VSDSSIKTRQESEDALAAIEEYYRRGWTDGLPVVPPTETSVRAMLEAARLTPDQEIGRVPTRRRTLTAEKIAINAVMAGCLPAYMPVVVAAVEALCDPLFSVHGPSASTSGQAVLLIVNGPVARGLGIHGGENCFGPGPRANATIGRAIRLILMNGLGATPGVLDRSVFGHPGKFTYCIAENEAESPWPPLHVERGCPAGRSAVTVLAAGAPHQVANATARTPEEILSTVADTMSVAGRLSLSGQEFCIVIGPPGRHGGKTRSAAFSTSGPSGAPPTSSGRGDCQDRSHPKTSGNSSPPSSILMISWWWPRADGPGAIPS